MVEAAGRSAAAMSMTMRKKVTVSKKQAELEKEDGWWTRRRKQQSSKQSTEGESPSYRLALKSLLSCRNSSQDGGKTKTKTKLGCSSAPSICKQLNKEGSTVKSELPSPKHVQQMQRGGGGSSSSFRAGMQLRRLSGCYECHMVEDPITGSGSSMRATTCPDCGEIFVRQESLQLHQSIRHAVCELGGDDTSRNIIEIIFQSSWLSPVCKIERILKVHNTARTLGRFEEYREEVKAKAAKAAQAPQVEAAAAQTATTTTTTTTTTSSSNNNNNKHPRCSADGNELLRFYCARLGCELGLNGATHLCSSPACAACTIIRHGFHHVLHSSSSSSNGGGGGVRTMATSGRAHDALPLVDQEQEERRSSRAMLVCRVIAGRVSRVSPHREASSASSPSPSPPPEEASSASSPSPSFDSVASSAAGVYSNLEELQVFNPRAILPCFVVVYKAQLITTSLLVTVICQC
ncbi:unnamed protein product [Urochloa humidicola]